NKYAGLLMLPYVIWLSYASYLNGGNLILNEDQPGYTRD
ncbi:tryptophan-rich sensory protein, partial [Staphylococcus epidermidis]|nr:tryptophan-rich sensory protein [Staphylococcus epidermidis]